MVNLVGAIGDPDVAFDFLAEFVGKLKYPFRSVDLPP